VEEQNIDLVLKDCEIPEMDGFESAKAIRQAERENGRQRLPIVALTAHALNEDRQKALDFGMEDFLSKPFGFEELRM
jgi:CheY-like chemotaxis protein